MSGALQILSLAHSTPWTSSLSHYQSVMIPSIQTQRRRDAIIRRAPNLPFTEILSAPLTLLSLSWITVNHRLILHSLSYPNHFPFNFCTPTMRVSLSFSPSLLLLTFTFQLFILAQFPPHPHPPLLSSIFALWSTAPLAPIRKVSSVLQGAASMCHYWSHQPRRLHAASLVIPHEIQVARAW